MSKKIIFVSYKEFENFEYEKYGGKIFEKNFKVEIWQLSKIFFGDSVVTKNVYPKQKKINTIKEFVVRMHRYNRKNTFVFFHLPSGQRKDFYLEALVSIMGFKYSMSYCQPYLMKWNTGSLESYMKKRKIDYVNAALNALFPPTFNFVAAPASYKEFPSMWSIKKQNNIMLHTLDYDVYLKIKDENTRFIEDKYILFVDESYVEHYDYQASGIKPPFKRPDDYYAPMRKFFDYIEKLYGHRVVIAEHPRAHYQDNSIYGNREMIRGETARLVRDAEFVLCHISMALDFIILFHKKFLLLYMDEIKNFFEWETYYIPQIKYLHIDPLNVGHKYDSELLKKKLSSGYSEYCQKYANNFIKEKGTVDKPFFEIVAENILKVIDN